MIHDGSTCFSMFLVGAASSQLLAMQEDVWTTSTLFSNWCAFLLVSSQKIVRPLASGNHCPLPEKSSYILISTHISSPLHLGPKNDGAKFPQKPPVRICFWPVEEWYIQRSAMPPVGPGCTFSDAHHAIDLIEHNPANRGRYCQFGFGFLSFTLRPLNPLPVLT